ncbi:MAG: uridylate kinase [Planctomycetales bacterium]|nr:uridylate kinase [Planctomycetales bacterium]
MSNLIVFKLGGSLLNLPDLAVRVRQVIRQRSNSSALIVVGGGAIGDVVRVWDRQHRLGDERAHWLAVEAMDLNSRFLAELLPESDLVANREQLHATVGVVDAASVGSGCKLRPLRGTPLILLPGGFLRQAEEIATRDTLPHTWDVTSDSIATWVAVLLEASELVLLKSTALPTGITFDQAAADGLVDRHFPRVADKLPRVSWCNLREPEPQVVAWCQSSTAETA